MALVLGLVLGAGFVIILQHATGTGVRAAHVANPSVPDGVDEVIDALESAAIVFDSSNNIIKASPGAYALGLIEADALAYDELGQVVDAVRATGRRSTSQLELARKTAATGSLFLSVRASLLGTRYVLLLAEDLTSAQRLDEIRRDFVANISHELKTPTGAVSLLAEAIHEASDDADQVRRFTKQLTRESARLSRITHEIIQLSRLQAADVLGTRETVEIDEVVADAIEQTRVAAQARKVTIVSGGTTGLQVHGDAPLLTVAVLNLISNAIIYSPKRSQVGIGVGLRDGTVEIAVTDQGRGIDAENLNRVFERFFRIDQARSRHTGGTGLGLSIVKHTIENHGGDVRVWSQPGVGSTFTIRLPLVGQTPEVPQLSSSTNSSPAQPAQSQPGPQPGRSNQSHDRQREIV